MDKIETPERPSKEYFKIAYPLQLAFIKVVDACDKDSKDELIALLAAVEIIYTETLTLVFRGMTNHNPNLAMLAFISRLPEMIERIATETTRTIESGVPLPSIPRNFDVPPGH